MKQAACFICFWLDAAGQEIMKEVETMIDGALLAQSLERLEVQIRHFSDQLNWATRAFNFMEPEARLSYALALENEAGSLRDLLFLDCLKSFGSQKCLSAKSCRSGLVERGHAKVPTR